MNGIANCWRIEIDKIVFLGSLLPPVTVVFSGRVDDNGKTQDTPLEAVAIQRLMRMSWTQH